MIKFSSPYRIAKDAGNMIRPLVVITTVRTRYIFGKTPPTDTEIGIFGDVNTWDGSHNTGDGGTFGGFPVSQADGLVLDFGSIRETLAPQGNDLLTSLTQTERGAFSINLDNVTGFFSELLGDNRNEPLLGQRLSIYQAFLGNESEDFIEVFSGEITQLTLTATKLSIVAESITSITTPVVAGTQIFAYGLNLVAPEPQAANTEILIHSNTTDGSTTFTDTSPNGWAVTAVPNADHSTTYAKFGASSMHFPAAGGYIEVLQGSPIPVASTLLTTEAFVYIPSAIASTVAILGWVYQTWSIVVSGGSAYWHVTGGGPTGIDSGYDLNAHTGEWIHLANTTEGTGGSTVHKLYVNGSLANSYTGALPAIGPPTGFYIQNYGGSNPDLYVDEFRLSSVVRDYTTFPPTAPYSDGASSDLIMAQATYTHAQAATLFASASWTCTINFYKTSLAEAGILFQLENQTAGDLTLEIGVDASNYPYCTTGQDIEGTPATTTYTSTQVLTAGMIANPINLRVYFDSTNNEIRFTVNGSSDTQAATDNYDMTGTASEQITIGLNFAGTVLNINFSDRAWWVNAENSNVLTIIPEILGGLDLTLVDATWEVW